jgi:hypothetical protein
MRTANSSSYAAERELPFFFVGWVDDEDAAITLPLLLALFNETDGDDVLSQNGIIVC